jgi:DNA polymerase-3 subunit delta
VAEVDARKLPALLAATSAWRAVLLFGDDPGLVRERADTIAAAVAPAGDPFRVAELAREAAARGGVLAAEMAALALVGGRRVVRVRDATDGLASAVAQALAGPGDALLLLEAGELPKGSKLRSLLMPLPKAAVVACYRERGAELSGTIAGLLREAGVAIDAEALDWLVLRLGDDRLLLRREIEKLVLFAGPSGRIDQPAALACIGDGLALDIDSALLAATAGDVALTDGALAAALAEGAAPVAVLRAAQRHVHRLHLAVVAGVEALRPPVFFRQRPAFERALRLWTPSALTEAGAALRTAEIKAKSGGSARPIPEATIARAAVLALARQAAIRARG